jgi:hypothetical protein
MGSKLVAKMAAFAASAALLLSGGATARADADPFDLNVASGGTVTVTAHSGWHINKDFPWKVTAGSTKIDKSAFTLGDTTATVSGIPTGDATVHGAVCASDDSSCQPFHKKISVP